MNAVGTPLRSFKCKKCKKETTEALSHKCEMCEVRLCRPCDNTSSYLNWVEMSPEIEVPDKYLCQKCEKKVSKPPEEPTQLKSIPLLEG
jgi:hypothetical protein